MICDSCGREAGGTIICPLCGNKTVLRAKQFREMFDGKNRSGLFYLTMFVKERRFRTISVSDSVTVSNSKDHTEIIVRTSLDGKEIEEREKINDTGFSHTETLVIAKNNGKILIMNYPAGTAVNGVAVSGPRTELSSGDIIKISRVTRIKLDTDLDRPSVIRGVLTPVPAGTKLPSEYAYSFGGNTYADGLVPNVGRSGLEVVNCDEKTAENLNRLILGPEYRRVLKEHSL